MSTKPATKHAAKKAPSAADSLIAKATQEKKLPASVRAELAKLMQHNDAAPRAQRVSAGDALALLSTLGLQMGRQTFDRMIAREFGRKWGTA